MGKLYSVLYRSGYRAIESLMFAITDKLAQDLMTVSDNARSGEYTLDEIADQIDLIIEMVQHQPENDQDSNDEENQSESEEYDEDGKLPRITF